MANHFHEANRHRWDAGSASWARHADIRGIWRKCQRDPSLALHSAELEWLRDIAGKSVAVLGPRQWRQPALGRDGCSDRRLGIRSVPREETTLN
jgi:hypothetical protein